MLRTNDSHGLITGLADAYGASRPQALGLVDLLPGSRVLDDRFSVSLLAIHIDADVGLDEGLASAGEAPGVHVSLRDKV